MNSISRTNIPVEFFQEAIFRPLIHLSKTILLIAAVAFAILTSYWLFCRSFKASRVEDKSEKPQEETVEPVTEKLLATKEVESPVIAPSTDVRMQKALEECIKNKATPLLISRRIEEIFLTTVGEWTPLSEEEMVAFGQGLGHLETGFIKHHFSANLIQAIVNNSLATSDLESILQIMRAMKTESFDKGQISAFVEGFEDTILKECCKVDQVSLLAQIFKHTAKAELVIETILSLHPPLPNDHEDQFFRKLLASLDKIDDHPVILEYVFKHESPKRQEILLATLSPALIVRYLPHIPPQMIIGLDDTFFFEVAEEVRKQEKSLPLQQLHAFAKGVTADKLYALIDQIDDEEFWKHFMPLWLLHLSERMRQVQFVSKVLDNASLKHGKYLAEAGLAVGIWEDGCKLNPARDYSTLAKVYQNFHPKIWAAILNGQKTNHPFRKQFFTDFYSDNQNIYAKEWLTSYLQPEMFEFEKPEEMKHSQWSCFFKVLREMNEPDELLIRSTLHLFNSPGFNLKHRAHFYTLAKEQLELLPIPRFKQPETRLLIASLSNRLDDTLIDSANMTNSIVFADFFYFATLPDDKQTTLPDYTFKKDQEYLNYFLLWVLEDNERFEKLHLAWKWIQIFYSNDILQYPSIQNDAKIQAAIKRLGLVI